MGKTITKTVPTIVQIAVAASQYSNYLYALDDDGKVWQRDVYRGSKVWVELDGLPEVITATSTDSETH